MRKRTILTLIAIALLSLLIIPSISAKKSTSYVTVSGHLEYVPTILESKIDGGNVYLSTTELGCWYDDQDYNKGDLIGYSENGPCTVIIFGSSDFPPTSGWTMRWYTAQANFEFFTVNGKTAPVVMRLVGKDSGPGTEWFGYWVIVDASGELEGINGSGTWWGPGWGPFQPGHIPFEGKVYFPS